MKNLFKKLKILWRKLEKWLDPYWCNKHQEWKYLRGYDDILTCASCQKEWHEKNKY